MESKWYESFFYGLAVELWGKVMSKEQTSEEVDFAVNTLSVPTGARLIDVPCGSGTAFHRAEPAWISNDRCGSIGAVHR